MSSEASFADEHLRHNQDQYPFVVQITNKKLKKQLSRKHDQQKKESLVMHSLTKTRSETNLNRKAQGQIINKKVNNHRMKMQFEGEFKSFKLIAKPEEYQSPLLGLGPSKPPKASKMITNDRYQTIDGSIKKAATQNNLMFKPRQYP